MALYRCGRLYCGRRRGRTEIERKSVRQTPTAPSRSLRRMALLTHHAFTVMSTLDELVAIAEANPVRGPLAAPVELDSATQRSDDIVPMVTNAFSNIPAYFVNVRDPELDRLVVEFALGVATNGNFNSRVRQSDWMAVRQLCENTSQAQARESLSCVDYWYSDSRALLDVYGMLLPPVKSSGHRHAPSVCITTTTAGAVTACQAKTSCLVTTLQVGTAVTAYAAYDVRLHFNYEQNMPALASCITEAGGALPAGWGCRRYKTRYRYVLSAAPDWAINLTLISMGPGEGEELVYEIEIEMSMTRETLPLGAPAQLRSEMARRGLCAWNSLVAHINVVRGRRREIALSPDDDVLIDCQPADDALARHTNTLFAQGAGCHGTLRRVFPGMMPVELTRAIWHTLREQPEDTWIAEKTDGMRLALLLDRQYGACTLDRTGRCVALGTRWPEWNVALTNVCTSRPTLLDAELVRNTVHGGDAHVLVVFDLVMYDGCPQYSAPFAARQKQMREFVNTKLRRAGASVRSRPFGLLAKHFVPLREFERLRAQMSQWDRSVKPPLRFIVYNAFHRFAVDGLVLMQLRNGRSTAAYKWKPTHKSTVDFYGQPELNSQQKFVLWCGVDEGRSVQIGSIELTSAQIAELSRTYLDGELLSRHLPRMPSASPLFECCWNPDQRCWMLVRFRTDKQRPNHFSVLVDALLTMAEPLTFAEIRADAEKFCAPRHAPLLPSNE